MNGCSHNTPFYLNSSFTVSNKFHEIHSIHQVSDDFPINLKYGIPFLSKYYHHHSCYNPFSILFSDAIFYLKSESLHSPLFLSYTALICMLENISKHLTIYIKFIMRLLVLSFPSVVGNFTCFL